MIFIYVPCQNLDTAKIIAKILVEKRMAGKVDIMLTNSVSRDNGLSAQAGGGNYDYYDHRQACPRHRGYCQRVLPGWCSLHGNYFAVSSE